mmetsp:Transcript_8140/g.17631  ORF Transcript_8140/g.17631 Transcript_8140/m.17631 type:complete len:264 (+) Transcript_8140:262-1053(+)
MRIFRMFALVLGCAWLLQTSDAYQPSGCEVCASTGQCSHAFKGGEGQYCGTWHDVLASAKKPCCCPPNTYCKVSQFECRCHVPGPASTSHDRSPEPYYYHAPAYQNSDPYWFVRFIFWILLILCCCCCCLPGFCSRKGKHGNSRGGGSDPSEYPTYSNWGSTFGSAPEAIPVAVPYGNPPAMNPEYRGGNTYGSTDHRGGGGGVGPALGGLAVGTAIGSMIGGRRSDGYFGGGGGHHHGGGYDIAGDSGGGHEDGGYDIAGAS